MTEVRTRLATAGVVLFVLLSSACWAEDSWLESTRAKFVQSVAGEWRAFEIVESVSRDADKRTLLNGALSTDAFERSVVVGSSELFLHQEGAPSRVHLGLATFEFETDGAAARAQKAAESLEEPYFEGSKVVTRFVSRRRGRRVNVAYSETVLNERVKHLLDELATTLEGS